MISRLSRRVLGSALLAGLAGLVFVAPAASQVPAEASAPAPGRVLYADDARAVPDRYIVSLGANTPGDDVDRLAGELTARYGGKKGFTYTAAMKGFSLEASADTASRLAGDRAVEYVAQDIEITPDALSVQVNPPSWGLDRIDQRSLPLDNKYHYPNTANSVTAYVIDTGILLNHQEFGGRAICGWDPYLGGCLPCPVGVAQFHGTHVAGTIGGRSVGVAKGVRIVSVRVFDCTGTTTAAVVIAGVNFVTLSQSLNPAQRSVANMSLGGGAFAPLDAAVTASIATNVHYSVAAGNSNANACLFSPAATPRATTVGSTNIADNRSGFSNFGPCLDVFAPGENIFSASNAGTAAYAVASGTSMAAPHAAGTAALWRHKFPADNADQVATALAANATPGVVINPGAGSPNLLLFMGMVPV
ncbi:MAG TPA: S8 family peptidase [Actinophytocola sp.]|uniref:S8 family peptidase n=1 Tax=Actinophytocola sp. TaxID=1872138 RepID=UPI002DB8DD94|nr:S8 family peptidase [Actinophytocola sp.]HEU5475588.1 S8 family peptidase [Actinophytocola sp.]